MKQKIIAISITAVLVMLAGVGILLKLKSSQKLGEPGIRLTAEGQIDLPETVGIYKSFPLPVAKVELDMLPKDTTFGRRAYYEVVNGRTNAIALSIVLMGRDRSSIHRPEFCLTGQGCKVQNATDDQLSMTQPKPYDIPLKNLWFFRDEEVGKKIYRQNGVYTYWFVCDGKITSSHAERMWWIAKDLLLKGKLQRWAYVSCTTYYVPGQEKAAYEKTKDFLRAALPFFHQPPPLVITTKS